MFEMNKIEAMDIDEKEDFLIAEAIHKVKTEAARTDHWILANDSASGSG